MPNVLRFDALLEALLSQHSRFLLRVMPQPGLARGAYSAGDDAVHPHATVVETKTKYHLLTDEIILLRRASSSRRIVRRRKKCRHRR